MSDAALIKLVALHAERQNELVVNLVRLADQHALIDVISEFAELCDQRFNAIEQSIAQIEQRLNQSGA